MRKQDLEQITLISLFGDPKQGSLTHLLKTKFDHSTETGIVNRSRLVVRKHREFRQPPIVATFALILPKLTMAPLFFLGWGRANCESLKPLAALKLKD